mmetsp:Transcript_83526/g.132013  ORF Transcript_83526/g.132013 Transcript_83526/m.132013 type:complete len:896 (+) Transcript_83526:2-2689(+)
MSRVAADATKERVAARRAYSWSSKAPDEDDHLNPATPLGFVREKLAEGPSQIRALETRRKRLFYRFEQLMAEKGRLVQIPALVLLGAFEVFVFGMMYSLVWRYEADSDPRPEERTSRYIEGFWAAWTYMADGGTHAKTFHAEQRFMGGIITVFGIIYLATVLAFIVDMVREKMDAMRVGRGQVHEAGHTVILNWTDRTIPLILELCIANESDGGGVVVVLAKETSETMLAELAMQLPKFMRRGTKIVVRHGNAAVVNDLLKVSCDRAKAVIILASGQSADESDSNTLRCILSLKSMGYKMDGHIVAEVRDIDNEQLLQLVGGRLVETFVSHDVLGRLMLMSVRQIGLAHVYDALMGFEGCEFYVKEWPQLSGQCFGDLLECFPEATVVGIQTAAGSMHLNPPMDMLLCTGDKVVVIAEDDDSYQPCDPVNIEVGDIPTPQPVTHEVECILMCGWRRDIRDILKVLNAVVKRGSEVHMMTHSVPVEKRNSLLLEEGLDVNDLKNLKIVHYAGNTSVRRRLEGLRLESYSSCLIFADQAYEEDAMQADSHSLATLVLIRDIQSQRQEIVTCPVTCEVLDSRTHRMITKQKQLGLLSDFVQSNKFVARILAMIGEQRSIKLILNELLGAGGTSIIIVASSTAVSDERLSFYVVAKRVALRNAVLIGYQDVQSKETTLNPSKKHEAIDWQNYDLILMAGNRQGGREGSLVDASQTVMPCIDEEEAMAPDAAQDSSRKIRKSELFRSSVTTVDAAPIIERTQSMELWTNAEKVRKIAKEHSEIGSSGDTAMETAENNIRKLAARFWLLMSDAEQRRFGSALELMGDRIKTGNFSFDNGPAASSRRRGDSPQRSIHSRGESRASSQMLSERRITPQTPSMPTPSMPTTPCFCGEDSSEDRV